MTDFKPDSRAGRGSRLIWFICLYCAGAVTVASVAYGVRFWVGG